jgi:hypothetical protein
VDYHISDFRLIVLDIADRASAGNVSCFMVCVTRYVCIGTNIICLLLEVKSESRLLFLALFYLIRLAYADFFAMKLR